MRAKLKNEKTGTEETVRAKFLVGSDGAASMIRKKLDIQCDGVSTDTIWGSWTASLKAIHPHAWVFGYGPDVSKRASMDCR